MSDTKRPRIVIFYNEGLNGFILTRPLIEKYGADIDIICSLPNIPLNPKTGRMMSRTFRRLVSSAPEYLVLNAMVGPFYNLMALFGGGSVSNLARKLSVRHKKIRVIDQYFDNVANYQRANIIFNFSSTIIKSEHIASASIGVVNFHGAPLPQYRGPANFFWMLIKREQRVWGALQYVVPDLDSGPIISKTEIVKIVKGQTVLGLWLKMRLLAPQLLIKFVQDVMDGEVPIGKAQMAEKACRRTFPKRRDVKLIYKNGYRLMSILDVLAVVRLSCVKQAGLNMDEDSPQVAD